MIGLRRWVTGVGAGGGAAAVERYPLDRNTGSIA